MQHRAALYRVITYM